MRRVLLAASLIAACVFAEPAAARGLARRVAGGDPTGDMRAGPGDAHGVLAQAERHLGQGNFTGMRGPWCADFVNAILRAAGLRPLPGRMAASALAYGPRTASPRPGDLAVMRGHVGFVVADFGGSIRIISGNWSRRVALATLPRRAFVAFVRV